MSFYIYAWYNIDNNYIFYIGKGIKNRYKNINQRNKIFKEYYTNNNCEVKIIEYFENELDAFRKENELILYYKSIGQCFCNLDNGGKGGCNFSWTEEMKNYMSKFNPMKNKDQKERMSINNPMKKEDIKKIVGEKHKRKIIINNKEYNGLIDASIDLNVWENTILNWVKRGYDTNGNPCRYENEPQKEYNFKVTNSMKVEIDGIIFDTVKEGAEYIGVWSESLIKAIKDNRKCKGYNCKYVNQQVSQVKSDNSNLETSTTTDMRTETNKVSTSVHPLTRYGEGEDIV